MYVALHDRVASNFVCGVVFIFNFLAEFSPHNVGQVACVRLGEFSPAHIKFMPATKSATTALARLQWRTASMAVVYTQNFPHFAASSRGMT